MDAVKRLASRRPISFGLVTTLLLWVCYVAAGVMAEVSSPDGVSRQMVEALGRIAGALFFLWLLWRLDWWGDVGIPRLGPRHAWLLALLVVVYQVLVHSYAFFGSLGLALRVSAQVAAVALNGSAAGLLEELAFRGVVMYALLRHWATSPGGLTRSVLVSSVLFGAAHLIRLGVGHPAPQVGMLVLDAFLAGIYYAAIVLRARSIWPAVAIHVLLNAFVGAAAVTVVGFEETVSAWVVILFFELPPVILGLYLLRGVRPTSAVTSGG